MTETEAEIEEMRKWFKHVAGNLSGCIDAKKLKRAMKKGGSGFELQLCEQLCRYASGDKEGKVSVDEFSKLHSFLSTMQQSFLYFDFDGDGELDMQEAYRAVAHAGFPLPPQSFRAIFGKYDGDQRLRLCYAQYVEMMLHLVSVVDECKNKPKPKPVSGLNYRRRMPSLAHYQYRATAGQNPPALLRSQSFSMSSGHDNVLMRTYSGVQTKFHSIQHQQGNRSNGCHSGILHTHPGTITEEVGNEGYSTQNQLPSQASLVSDGLLDTGAGINLEVAATPPIFGIQEQRRLHRYPSRLMASESDLSRVVCGQWLGADATKTVDATPRQQMEGTRSMSVSLHTSSFRSPFENYKQSVLKQGRCNSADLSYRTTSLQVQSNHLPSNNSHDSVYRSVSTPRNGRLGHSSSVNLDPRASSSPPAVRGARAHCSRSVAMLEEANIGDCWYQTKSLQDSSSLLSYKSDPEPQNFRHGRASSSHDSLSQSSGVKGKLAGGSVSLPQVSLSQLESWLPSSQNGFHVGKGRCPGKGANVPSPFHDFPSPFDKEPLTPTLQSNASRTSTLWSAGSDLEGGEMRGDLIEAYQTQVDYGTVSDEAQSPCKTCYSAPLAYQLPESVLVDEILDCGSKPGVKKGRKSLFRKLLGKKRT